MTQTTLAPADCDHPAQRLFAHAPSGVAFKKLRKRLARQAAEAMATYAMLPPPGARERWLVCVSGGKDSHGLLAVLLDLQAQGRLEGVELLACNLDQGQPGFDAAILPDHFARLGVAHRIERRDTYSVVTDKIPQTKTYCALCSRLRRGHLYRVAREEACAAIVLGHHRDDAVETLFMNMTRHGRMEGLAPTLRNDEGDVAVHRPLIGCAEDDLAAFAKAMRFPIIPCDLCGSQDGLERQVVKRLLADWETRLPGMRESLARAMAHVRPGTLMDPALHAFGHAGGKRE